MRDWKVDRAYKVRLETRQMPEAVQARVVDFVRAVWEAARADVGRDMAEARDRMKAKVKATDEVMNEMAARLDATEALNARLTSEADGLRKEVKRLRKRLDHVRAEDFWDRVMQEVHDLRPPDGEMKVEEILPRLKPSVHRGARLHKEPLDAATLRKKLKVRTYHRKYVAEGDDGGFVRRVG
jgi:predicted transcriptional regulator